MQAVAPFNLDIYRVGGLQADISSHHIFNGLYVFAACRSQNIPVAQSGLPENRPRLDTRDLELALQDAGFALEQQQISFDNLLADPREADLVAAQAAVYAASTQLEAARVPPDERLITVAEYQYELALNQLWQQQARRDSTAEQREQLEDLNVEAVQLAATIKRNFEELGV